MLRRLRRELAAFVAAAQTLDAQTVFVLLASSALVFVQNTLGSRSLFREHLAQFFNAEWQGLLSWGWWFLLQGVTGFIIPVLCLLLLFRRRPSEIGLGLGDWKLALTLGALYVPLVAAGTWVLSSGAAFQADYPHYSPAAFDWRFFLIYEALFLFYWIGWEYLWRGFVLFGTAQTFGLYAIVVQTVPFALMHSEKPPAEAFLSILGGVALGALVWRCRSFWIAVPIHSVQMFLLDFFSTLRLRTGAQGYGLAALRQAFGAFVN